MPQLVSNDSIEDEDEKERIEDQHFQTVYGKWKGANAKDTDITYKVIPKFYFKVKFIIFLFI
jgi:hypothetical protein